MSGESDDTSELLDFEDCEESSCPPPKPPRSSAGQGSNNATGTAPPSKIYAIQQPAECSVTEVASSVFKVRTRAYLDDSVKAPSADALFTAVGFDIYYPQTVGFLAKTPGHTFPKYPTDAPGFSGHATRSMRYPDFIAVNMVISLERPKVLPEAMTNLWSKIRRQTPEKPGPRPYVQFIVTLAIPPALKLLLESQSLEALQATHPQLAMAKRLFDSNGIGDDDISSRIKIFGACSNMDKLSELGLPLPLVAFLRRYNGKPMLSRNHTLHNSHKWPRAADVKPPTASSPSDAGGYFEILMDVAEKWSVISQTTCCQLLAKPELSALGLYLGLLLEGREEAELPERMWGGLVIRDLLVAHPAYDNQAGAWLKQKQKQTNGTTS